MPASTVTEFLYFASRPSAWGDAEVRERLRRANAADPGPATLDARLRLGRPAIAARPDDDQVEAERNLATAGSLQEKAGAMWPAAGAIHGLALRAPHRYDPAHARQRLDESPAVTEVAAPSPAHAL
jgi:hypothetical protein